MPQTTSFDFPATLRAWADITRDAAIPLGAPVAEVLRLASLLVLRLDHEPIQGIAGELQPDPDASEVMHALVQVLQPAGDQAGDDHFARLCRAYELASLLSWDDEIDEGREIRGQLALLAWRHARRFRNYRETKFWEHRCITEALSQEHLCDFLALPSSARSDELACRYFQDPAVLLALSHKFESERNRNFAWVGREAFAAYATLERLEIPADDEERAFFLSGIAFSIANSCRHLGSLRSSDAWTSVARNHLNRVLGSRPYRAIVEFLEVINRMERLDLSHLLEPAKAIRQELRECGVDWHVACASLLIAGFLKDTGRFAEAAAEYQDVVESQVAAEDPLVMGIALQNLADVRSHMSTGVDLDALRRAQAEYERCGARWPLAQLQGSIAEWLRDRGRLDEAIGAYRASVRSYDELSMKSRAAYMRLLLAETLIVRGQDHEAIVEITRALEFAEIEGIAADLRAGGALLRQALSRTASHRESDATNRLRAIRQLNGFEKR